MRRNLEQLSRDPFDLLVIGGGIQGAALLWLAQRSGLRAALVEKDDFGGATSANSQKVIHGGLRYLQHLDLPRTLESIRARRLMLGLAPHLVRPMPCLLPLYGHGLRGREAMAVGMGIYNRLSGGANRGLDPAQQIPPATLITPEATIGRFPLVDRQGLRGAALWHDARCDNTERLTLAFVRTARALGAATANRVEAGAPSGRAGGTCIVQARDRLNDGTFDIRARHVARCLGPWLEWERKDSRFPLTLGINVVVPALHDEPVSLAVRQQRHSGGRMYFVVPWRGGSIVGTAWLPYRGQTASPAVRAGEVGVLIDGFNAAWRGRPLSLADVRQVHAGLVPCRAMETEPRLLGRENLIVRNLEGGARCIDVRSVKYTTALTVAEKALRRLDLPCHALSMESRERLVGAAKPATASWRNDLGRRLKGLLPDAELDRVAADYGSETETVLALGASPPPGEETARKIDLLAGMTRFALRHEMAGSLADVVLRRTGLGSAGPPSRGIVERIAGIMTEALSWSDARREEEIRHLMATYPDFVSVTG